MLIRRLLPLDAGEFQALRLQGLRECPTAFASSYEEECDEALSVTAERLAANPMRGMFGAFSGSTLVGVIGLQREEMRKLDHKALIWGMYVAPEFRRMGIARQLVDQALKNAFAMPGVRQVNLSVNAANVPAVALYETVGFKPFGVERGFMVVNGAVHNEIHMVYFGEET